MKIALIRGICYRRYRYLLPLYNSPLIFNHPLHQSMRKLIKHFLIPHSSIRRSHLISIATCGLRHPWLITYKKAPFMFFFLVFFNLSDGFDDRRCIVFIIHSYGLLCLEYMSCVFWYGYGDGRQEQERERMWVYI